MLLVFAVYVIRFDDFKFDLFHSFATAAAAAVTAPACWRRQPLLLPLSSSYLSLPIHRADLSLSFSFTLLMYSMNVCVCMGAWLAVAWVRVNRNYIHLYMKRNVCMISYFFYFIFVRFFL